MRKYISDCLVDESFCLVAKAKAKAKANVSGRHRFAVSGECAGYFSRGDCREFGNSGGGGLAVERHRAKPVFER